MYASHSFSRSVSIPADGTVLQGDLTIPRSVRGLAMFAHGSGSSRFSSRNQHVAAALQERHLATLLFDLLTPDEERLDEVDASLRFDVDFLAGRLISATDWMSRQPIGQTHPIGYFGASTGAAAALIAAARRPELVQAIVSRGGRPDLAGDLLPDVQAPTLFIVGGNDRAVLELNREAAVHMSAPRQIVIVPRATHLFEEPGALDQVARLAGDWLLEHFRSSFDHVAAQPT